MPTPKPFSEAEWKSLQFAVLDVFMMVSNVEGEGIDDAEARAPARRLGAEPGLRKSSRTRSFCKRRKCW